jgi:hypothetical protein
VEGREYGLVIFFVKTDLVYIFFVIEAKVIYVFHVKVIIVKIVKRDLIDLIIFETEIIFFLYILEFLIEFVSLIIVIREKVLVVIKEFHG